MSRAVVAGLLVAAVLGLTAALGLTGGSGTPFSFLYLFPLVLGAQRLRPAPAWGLFALTLACYASLFWLAPASLHHHDAGAMEEHLWGMYAGFAATAAVVVGTVARGRRLEQESRAVQEAASRLARVRGLAALAAGAAHELRTPLGTMLLVATEQRRKTDDPALAADMNLLVEEIERCREVVDQLSHAGEGEAWQEVELLPLLSEALRGMPVTVRAEGRGRVPAKLLGQVARRLAGNAVSAAGTATVTLTAGEELRLVVADEGPGMSPELLQRATEPFFTTHGEGQGRGLGLFFCDAVARELGGRLLLESRSSGPSGTTVTFHIPVPS